MDIKGTQTAENLRKALAGESIARNKYTYFAMAARANGDEEMAAAFEQMAQNEMMHARFWFELLYGKPTDTKECLTQAAMGEYGEWHDMYPDFAAQARAEGLEDIAVMFEKVAAIEVSNRLLRLCLNSIWYVSGRRHYRDNSRCIYHTIHLNRLRIWSNRRRSLICANCFFHIHPHLLIFISYIL